jgi:16S rRNA (cytidine1402-2'-O)-methyltransferase
VTPPGRLVLVGTPIGNLGDLTPRAIDALRDADVVACEDTRRTRALLTHAGLSGAGRLRSVHASNEAREAERIVDAIREGRVVAYASDAGMPGISDPGARLVRACIDAGLQVDVVPGVSAVLTALVVSGLAADRFCFEGFLPRKGAARRARLQAIASSEQTVVLYEAPARVHATLGELLDACGPQRRVAVARELTKMHEEVVRGELGSVVEQVGSAAARGEYVVVLEGVDPPAEVDEGTVESAVAEALQNGLSARDASAEVADALGVSKRRAYEVAVRLRAR